jgi:integrase
MHYRNVRCKNGKTEYSTCCPSRKLLEDFQKHQKLRADQGWKPATIDLELCHVKRAVTEAFYNDKLDGRVLKSFKGLKNKLKRGSNARKRTITFKEYLILVDAAKAHFKPVLTAAYNTGMRSGELQKLQWSHVDRKNMFIRLPGEITKTGDPRDIPINHYVKSALDALPRSINHGFVFTCKGKPFTHKHGFKYSLKDACKKAGIPYGRNDENGVTMHDMRRTLKTNMLNAGIDKVYRDKILGHSLTGMDVHYLAPDEDTLKYQMERFTQWLDGQLNSANVDQGVDQGMVTG